MPVQDLAQEQEPVQAPQEPVQSPQKIASEAPVQTEAQPLSFDALLRSERTYQSAFDRKVEKALQTARANWEREQAAALEQQRAQALEQAQQQAQAEYRQRLGELELREAQHEQRVRQVETADQLVQLGLPAQFAPWLTGDSSEDCRARVSAFDAAFRAAVRDAVTERMAGAPPAQPQLPQSYDRQSLQGMTRQEINAHWAEIQHALKG